MQCGIETKVKTKSLSTKLNNLSLMLNENTKLFKYRINMRISTILTIFERDDFFGSKLVIVI